MEKKRVKEGKIYWYINSVGHILATADVGWPCDRTRFENNNYFTSQEEAEAMVRKIKAVLAGVDVVQKPSEEEIKQVAFINDLDFEDSQIRGFKSRVEWLKSKIIKVTILM